MITRRPRIKASANLMSSKRKTKSLIGEDKKPIGEDENKSVIITNSDLIDKEADSLISNVKIIDDKCADHLKGESQLKERLKVPILGDSTHLPGKIDISLVQPGNAKLQTSPISVMNSIETRSTAEHPNSLIHEKTGDQNEMVNLNGNISAVEPVSQSIKEMHSTKNSSPTVVTKEESFKCPRNLDYNPTTCANEDMISSDIEESVIQMDLQKSISDFPMSPSKCRQRIRPTPIFGQRRNSFVGNSPSPHTEDEHIVRRERNPSTSLSNSSTIHYNPVPVHKFFPGCGSIGRIRTESGCSTFSDSHSRDYGIKPRKSALEEQRALTRKDFLSRFNGDVPDKSLLKMVDLIYYNPLTNPMEQKSVIRDTDLVKDEAKSLADEKNYPSSEQISLAAPVPQLKLGSNGEMMIDETSLVIETTAEKEARKILANSSLIYLDENTGNNGFYKRQKRTKDWPPEETIKFYRCLQTVGTDFSLMLTLFPKRSRRDLKLKFKKEERCNLNLINKALLYPKIFNIDELKVQLETEEQERIDAEKRWKEIKAQGAKTVKKVLNAASPAVRVISDGEGIYQNENITKRKLGKRAKTVKVNKSSEIPNRKKRSKKSKAVDINTVENTFQLEPCQTKKYIYSNDSENTKTEPLMEEVDNHQLEQDLTDILQDDGVDTDMLLILTELAHGSLVFMSSIDPSNPEMAVNEIYRMNNETGVLFEKPLDLPDDIIQRILSVMS